MQTAPAGSQDAVYSSEPDTVFVIVQKNVFDFRLKVFTGRMRV